MTRRKTAVKIPKKSRLFSESPHGKMLRQAIARQEAHERVDAKYPRKLTAQAADLVAEAERLGRESDDRVPPLREHPVFPPQWGNVDTCSLADVFGGMFAPASASPKLPQTQSARNTVLDEAAAITSGDRQADYGHPIGNHTACALAWTGYLRQRKLIASDATLTAEDVCWLMVALKFIRAGNKSTRDCMVDVCGYVRNIEMIGERQHHQMASEVT